MNIYRPTQLVGRYILIIIYNTTGMYFSNVKTHLFYALTTQVGLTIICGAETNPSGFRVNNFCGPSYALG
jgi:hypothetical protein